MHRIVDVQHTILLHLHDADTGKGFADGGQLKQIIGLCQLTSSKIAEAPGPCDQTIVSKEQIGSIENAASVNNIKKAVNTLQGFFVQLGC